MAQFEIVKDVANKTSTIADFINIPSLTQVEINALTGVSVNSMLFNSTIGLFQVYNGVIWSSFAYLSDIPNESKTFLFDDFTGAATTSGLIGALGWSMTNCTTANGAFSSQNHPFVRRFTVANVTNAAGIVHLNYVANAGNIAYGDISEAIDSVRINSALNRQLAFIGISENWTTTPQNNAVFRKVGTLVSTWQCDVRVAGVLTTVDSGVAVTNNFTKFKIKTFPAKVEFYIDDVLVATINTAPAANILMQPAVDVINNGTLTGNTFDMDYFSLKTNTLAR